MTTYARTALGTAVVLNNSPDFPRKLRTLLIAVDGRTDSASFERNLSSFGDVLALLDSLKMAGYIEETDADVFQPKANAEWAKTQPSIPPSDYNASDARYLEERRTYRDVTPTYRPASGATFARGGGDKSRVAKDQLKAAVSLMSDFVAQHLPAQALEIVIELERLSSVEALMQSLGGYEHLIKPAGDAGQRHLRELRAVLTRS